MRCILYIWTSNMKEQRKNIAIWLRVSTDDQVRGESPEVHQKRAEMYAEQKGWNVVKIYRLDAVSGKSVIHHPIAQEMLRDVENGLISALVFSKLARLARNTTELLQFSEHFQKHNADLVSLHESIDTSSPAGRLYFSILASMATWEREEISARVAASVPVRAKMGKSLGGKAPYGYKWVDKKLEIDESEAPIRKLIYELFLKHERLRTVARLMNEKGHRTRNNTKFSDTTIKRLIKDPLAKGTRRINYTRSLGEGKSWEVKPQDDWVYIEAPAIISEEMWDQVNNILEKRRQTKKRVSRLNTHLFGGIAQCHCGGKMYVPVNSPKYICRSCKNRIRTEDLESLYIEALRLELTSEATFKKASEDKKKMLNDKKVQLGVMEKKKSKLKNQLSQLFELHSEGQIQTKDFASHYEPKKNEIDQLEQEILVTQSEIDYLNINTSDLLEVLESSVYLRDNWSNLTFDKKRDLVRRCTSSIDIGTEDITINLITNEHRSFETLTKEQRKLMDS